MKEEEKKLLLFMASIMLIDAHDDEDNGRIKLLRKYLQPFKVELKSYAEAAVEDAIEKLRRGLKEATNDEA